MKHAAKELRYTVDLLAADGATVLLAGAGAGITDLSGNRLVQAQLMAEETTHMILLRYLDAKALPKQGYVRVIDPDTSASTLYIVDYIADTRNPRPRIWTEVYCHVLVTQ